MVTATVQGMLLATVELPTLSEVVLLLGMPPVMDLGMPLAKLSLVVDWVQAMVRGSVLDLLLVTVVF